MQLSRPRSKSAHTSARPRDWDFQRLLSRGALAEGATGHLTAVMAAMCIVLGGATRTGSLGDVVLQFGSVILLLASLREIVAAGALRRLKATLAFVAAVVLVPVIQLVPLPVNIWQLLPQRGLVSEAYALIKAPQPLLPITLTPNATWLSGLALLPPMAIFFGALTLDTTSRRRLGLIVVAMGVASVFLGLLQLAQGPNSRLRFYEITNRFEAVGFFANRNHFAALLYVSILFAATYLVEAVIVTGQSQRRRRIDLNSVSPIVTWSTAIVIMLAGEMMARSRAGLILSVPALLVVAFLGSGDPRLKTLRPGFAKTIAGSMFVALLLLAPLALYRVADRLQSDPNADVRIPFARNTLAAAMDFMPSGSGLGSFVPVYQLYEKPSDIGIAFANHAHNDLLELWLETGVPGLALMGVFGVWVILRTLSIWNGADRGERGIDLSLQRAASATLLLLSVHSLVDYPLRTAGMMAVAAIAAGYLVPPFRANRTDVPP